MTTTTTATTTRRLVVDHFFVKILFILRVLSLLHLFLGEARRFITWKQQVELLNALHIRTIIRVRIQFPNDMFDT